MNRTIIGLIVACAASTALAQAALESPYEAALTHGTVECVGKTSWNAAGSKTLRIESGYLCPITFQQCLTMSTVRTYDGETHEVLGCGTSRETGSWYVDFDPRSVK